VMFGWLREERDESACRRAGWAGVMSLPRWLHLSAQGDLLMEPVPELKYLRTRMPTTFSGDLTDTLVDLAKDTPVIHAELSTLLPIEQEGKVTFTLAETPCSTERTLIACDFTNQILSVDTRFSSLDPMNKGNLKEAPLPIRPGELLELRIFIDGSVLEIFAGHQVVISSRFYPKRASRLHLFAHAENAVITLEYLHLWELGDCFI
jgi:beta-fructofuranosidase